MVRRLLAYQSESKWFLTMLLRLVQISFERAVTPAVYINDSAWFELCPPIHTVGLSRTLLIAKSSHGQHLNE